MLALHGAIKALGLIFFVIGAIEYAIAVWMKLHNYSGTAPHEAIAVGGLCAGSILIFVF